MFIEREKLLSPFGIKFLECIINNTKKTALGIVKWNYLMRKGLLFFKVSEEKLLSKTLFSNKSIQMKRT